jgi:type I restriction enzyme R subunit
LAQDATLALHLDEKIRAVKKADWRGNKFKEREVRNAIASVLETQVRESGIPDVDTVLELVKNQNDY